MSRRGQRPCAGSPLCPNPAGPGPYCLAHTRRKEADRGSSHARGYDADWHRTRARYLRDHQVCENCGATAETSGHPLEVDHIDGLGPLGPRGHDPANLQTLCRSCHQTKTAHQARTKGTL
jgi:5-methylcytosine-specific restriction protein A